MTWELQGGTVKYSEIGKWQCRSSPYNLNSSVLSRDDCDTVFHYLIITYTAPGVTLQIAEVPTSRILDLRISCVASHRGTSRWFWVSQLIKTLPQPLHSPRRSSALMNWCTSLATFSRWKNSMRSTPSWQSEFQKIKPQWDLHLLLLGHLERAVVS